MEDKEFGGIVAGAIITILISILKRWVTLSKVQVALLALTVSFLVASGMFLLNGKTWQEYVSSIAIVYSSSQAIYWLALKETGLGDKIEGK